jgi:adenylate cyclase
VQTIQLRKYYYIVAVLLFSGWNTSTAEGVSDTTRIKKILDLSQSLQSTSQDSAYLLATEAYRLSQDIQFQKGIATSCMRMGHYFYARGQNDTALACYRKALQIRKSLRDFNGASGACIMMSYVFTKLGKKDSVFGILYEALRLNRFSKDSVNLAYTYISLGNLCIDYGDLNASLKYYLKAESIASIIKNQNELSLAYGGLGNYYFNTGHIENALSYFIKKEMIDRNAGDPVARAQSTCNIALCYDQLHDYSKASRYYHMVVAEYKKMDMRSDLAHVYFNLGGMFISRKMADSAIFYLQKALLLGRETNDQVRIVESLNSLSEAFAIKKNYMQAYRYHLQYTELNDSIVSQEKIKSIAEMQTKYDAEKKEQRIALLDAQNKTRATQRNFLFIGSILLILLAGSIFMGLMKTARERKKSDELLLNILPVKVADELKKTGSAEAKHFDEVTVMFTDFKGFTTISEKLSAAELVTILHSCFTAFDRIIQKYNLEKIKTIGDSYFCAGGLPVPNTTHAYDMVNAALEIQAFMRDHAEQMKKAGKDFFEIRIGIHTGPVIAGIVGIRKFAYDIWGDTVNTASRMESSGEVGRINISGATWQLVKDRFSCTHRGMIEAKNKGKIDMYFVNNAL